MINCVVHIAILRHFNAYKSSAVAEMGDRLITIDAGRKVGGGLLCPFPWGAGSPSNAVSPESRPTPVPVTKWRLDPSNRLAITPILQTGQKDNGPVTCKSQIPLR